MWIECHSEKQRKIAENRLAKSCDSGVCKITLSVGKGCKGVFVMEKSKAKELAEYITEQLAGLEGANGTDKQADHRNFQGSVR